VLPKFSVENYNEINKSDRKTIVDKCFLIRFAKTVILYAIFLKRYRPFSTTSPEACLKVYVFMYIHVWIYIYPCVNTTKCSGLICGIAELFLILISRCIRILSCSTWSVSSHMCHLVLKQFLLEMAWDLNGNTNLISQELITQQTQNLTINSFWFIDKDLESLLGFHQTVFVLAPILLVSTSLLPPVFWSVRAAYTVRHAPDPPSTRFIRAATIDSM